MVGIQSEEILDLYMHTKKVGGSSFVDDDNIPYRDWGRNLEIGNKVNIDTYTSRNGVFDPLSVTKYNDLWHRGYPIQLLNQKIK